jgi:hypothetical protein
MKKKFKSGLVGLVISLLIILPSVSNGQSEKAVIKKYLSELPSVPVSSKLQKYRMTAVYINRDLYGNFTGKIKVVGDYTRGLENGFVSWSNVYIASSDKYSEPFPEGTKQEYMENIEYIPSPEMLDEQAFKDFPAGPENVFNRNLIWDMMAIEGFAWKHTDSLELNKIYRIPLLKGEFNMADVGTYTHAEVQLCWTGISAIDDELCAVIEYNSIDNKVEISIENIKTKGTEQYWGTVWVSLETRLIGRAVMYSGTIQEVEETGMDYKFLVKTIRELWVEKIQ